MDGRTSKLARIIENTPGIKNFLSEHRSNNNGSDFGFKFSYGGNSYVITDGNLDDVNREIENLKNELSSKYEVDLNSRKNKKFYQKVKDFFNLF